MIDSGKENERLVLTPSQREALNRLKTFVESGQEKVFILTGYAGTGKTTLMKMFINWLSNGNHPFELLASTGRAAKVLSNKAGSEAKTIHSCIYTFDAFNQDIERLVQEIDKHKGVDTTGQLLLQFETLKADNEDYKQRIYIVDEASMVPDVRDKNPTQAIFGTGKVLTDLLNYDAKGRFIFVGDACQLPPMLQDFSPALAETYMQDVHHVKVAHARLQEIVRQEDTNDIIQAAARVRMLYEKPARVTWAKFPLRGYQHIEIHPSQISLIDAYIRKVKEKGFNATTLICGSNRSCGMLSQLIRPALGFHSGNLEVGELLLVTQNNLPTGLMNGDFVKVVSIGNRIRQAELTFLHVEVCEMVTEQTYSLLLIEDILYSGMTNLSQISQKALFIDFYRRMKEKKISSKSQELKDKMKNDPYLNALRVVYGYAITCHKAQGGEWEDVYLDIPRYLSHNPTHATYQWLYTAVTRASNRLHVVDAFFIA